VPFCICLSVIFAVSKIRNFNDFGLAEAGMFFKITNNLITRLLKCGGRLKNDYKNHFNPAEWEVDY
jgi:hypothetical protein